MKEIHSREALLLASLLLWGGLAMAGDCDVSDGVVTGTLLAGTNWDSLFAK